MAALRTGTHENARERNLLRATTIIARGDWSEEATDTVVLDYDDRHRRRIMLETVSGLSFLLDLPAAVALRTGDAARLSDGRLVEIIGAAEPLCEIRAQTQEELTRLAWHLGNRHLPVQIVGSRLRIRRDHVIETMVEGLGGKIRAVEAAFDPEGGAYLEAKAYPDAKHGGHHDHGHHDHDHAHHTHAHDHAHDRAHDHHAHDHAQKHAQSHTHPKKHG